MSKFTSAMHKHYKKAVVLATVAYTNAAMAAIDVSSVVSEVDGLDAPINQIGAATVGVVVVMYGWRKVRGAIR